MDLVGIMHVVDMPSAGKHDFNYLCSWFDIVYSDPLGISFVWYSSYWFPSFSQCAPNVLDWSMNVHGMVVVCCSKSVGSCSCEADVSTEPKFNVYVLSLILHGYCSSDASCWMDRVCLPLCSIMWCQLLDRPAAQTLHTPIDTCIFCSNIHL